MDGENPLMESSGCKSRTTKASTQVNSERCHSPGDDWWVRSVHGKEAGHEDSAPKTRHVAMPTPLTRRNGGYSQATPTAHRPLSYSER
jgi:hypothetical protein